MSRRRRQSWWAVLLVSVMFAAFGAVIARRDYPASRIAAPLIGAACGAVFGLLLGLLPTGC